MIHRTSRAIAFCVACFAVVVGIAGRIDGLDHKLFWQDEAFSMLRITGHDEAQLYGSFDGRVRSARSFLALDRLDAASTFSATIASLREEPQRGPLFYLAARVWAGAFGDGVYAMRVFPSLLGVACIGLAFGLGRRLAGDALGGATLAALVAISPIELHFSQQVREYVLIAGAILASSWSLFGALDRPTIVRWTTYAIVAAAGLFTSPIFAAVLVAHAAVALGSLRRVPASARSVSLGFGIAVAAALAAYAPWALPALAASHAHAGDLAWLHGDYSPRSFALKWAFNIGAVFFDAEFARPRFGVVLLPLFALVALAAIAALRRPTNPLPNALALATTLCSAIPLVTLDVATHAHFETVTRYQMATWIGIDMLVALALASWLRSARSVLRIGAVAAFAFVVVCGAFSAGFDRAYAVWWDDNEHLDERLVARTIATGRAPALVLVSKDGAAAPYALVLAHYLPPDAAFLSYESVVPEIPAWGGDVYLFVPSTDAVADARGHFALSGFGLRNVSPALGLSIPDLRSAHDARDAAALGAQNALWIRVRD
jgi:uncharacterized membrane protein